MQFNLRNAAIAITLLILTPLLISRCDHSNVVVPSVTPAVYTTPTASDRKLLPGVQKVIKIPHVVAPLGYTVKQEVLVGVSNTVITRQDALIWRYTPSWGIYLDGTLSGIGGGLRMSPIGVWRINVDLLAGYPRIGAGLDYQVFRNTYLGLDYSENYIKLLPEPGIYATLNF